MVVDKMPQNWKQYPPIRKPPQQKVGPEPPTPGSDAYANMQLTKSALPFANSWVISAMTVEAIWDCNCRNSDQPFNVICHN